MQFNTQTDWEASTQEFAKNKRIRIDNILSDSARDKLYNVLSGEIAFDNAFLLNQQVRTASDQELNRLPMTQKQELQRELFKDAAKGYGFFYGTYRITKEAGVHPVMREFYDWINSDEVLAKIKEVTGKSDILSANCQGTRYKVGDYLTRHNDVNTSEGREIAYVFNLTPNWHPDWGGLLQFFTQDGAPQESYSPKFNSLSLFDVTIPHSVTYVAPFAQQRRLAVTGWFCHTHV